jgi:hypothetical protein
MGPDVRQIDAQTRLTVTDRDQGLIMAVIVTIERLPGDQRGARIEDIENHLIAALRFLMQSHRGGGPDRAPGFVHSMSFRSSLNQYLQSWYASHRPNIRGEWTVEVPIRLHRRFEAPGATDPGNQSVIDNVTVIAGPAPPPPPRGRIDTIYERTDEVLDRLDRDCGDRNAMSQLIQRWRRGEINQQQAAYLIYPWVYNYVRMARSDPRTPDSGAVDIRRLFEERAGGSSNLEERVRALQSAVVDGINRANRYIHDQLELINAGSPPREAFSPDRVLTIRDWIYNRSYLSGSVYHALQGQSGPCASWLNIRYYSILSDYRRHPPGRYHPPEWPSFAHRR